MSGKCYRDRAPRRGDQDRVQPHVRVALAQLNPIVGDIDGNAERARAALRRAADAGAAVTLLPELAVTGYPPEDLLLRPDFAMAARSALDELAAEVRTGVAVVGFPEWDRDCFNSAAVVADGRVQAVYRKRFLPNYGVFDEARYFRAGTHALVAEARGVRLGMVVCEDVWYPGPVANDLATAGVDVVCCISASPYHRGKAGRREEMLATRAADASAPLLFCTQVGGQDSSSSTAGRPSSTRRARSSPGRRTSRRICSSPKSSPTTRVGDGFASPCCVSSRRARRSWSSSRHRSRSRRSASRIASSPTRIPRPRSGRR